MKFWQAVSFMEPEQMLGVAQAAEEAGFHGLLLADHLFFPGKLASKYPYSEDGAPMFDGRTPFPGNISNVTQDLFFQSLGFRLLLHQARHLLIAESKIASVQGADCCTCATRDCTTESAAQVAG